MSGLKYVSTFASQMFPPKSKFSVEQMPDLTGRVCIVTGGNVGVGWETIKALLNKNAKVYMASRNKTKATEAIDKLREEIGKEALFLELDLSSLASVRRAAEEYLSKERELHILFNNAGVMNPPVEQRTTEGYDLQFGTNVIGHFYFTKLLIPALAAGQASSPDGYSRVIHTSSSVSYFHTISWDTIKDTPERKKLGSRMLYCQSKFANVVLARQFAQHLEDRAILSIACNPGNLKSELQRYQGNCQRKIGDTILYPASYGALTQLWAGTMSETIQYNGEYLIPWARHGRTRDEAYDPELGEKLWDWLHEEVRQFDPSI